MGFLSGTVNILGAQQWHDEIGAALRRCDWFVLVLSPNAIESIWVKRELLFSLQQNRFEDKIINGPAKSSYTERPGDGRMVAQHILDKEGTRMPYRWPEDTGCTRLALAVAERWCRTCGGALTTCDHRQHRVCTLNGPLHLGCTLAHGPRAPARPLPRRCVQTPSPRSPGRGGASAGMGGVGWASAAVPATGQWGRAGPPWPTRPRCACPPPRARRPCPASTRCWPPAMALHCGARRPLRRETP